MHKILSYDDEHVDKTYPENKHRTALFYAAETNAELSTAGYDRRGADVNHVDDDGETPLVVAVRHNSTHVIKTLLASGADPSVQSGDSSKATTPAKTPEPTTLPEATTQPTLA